MVQNVQAGGQRGCTLGLAGTRILHGWLEALSLPMVPVAGGHS